MVINVSNGRQGYSPLHNPSPVKGEGLLWLLHGRFKVNGTAVIADMYNNKVYELI
jgi:hypothetical protein